MHGLAIRIRRAMFWRSLSLALSLSLLVAPAQSGVLDTVRSEVRESDGPSRLPDTDEDDDKDDDDDDDRRHRRHRDRGCEQSPNYYGADDDCHDGLDGSELGAIGFLAGVTVLAPIWVPISFLDDDYAMPGVFAEYPYSPDTEGSMLIGRLGEHDLKPWSAKLLAEYGTDFGDLQRIGGRLQLSTNKRIDFDTEWNSIIEDTASNQDQLWLGDFNAVFRFAQSDNMQFRTGIGFNWLHDDRATDFGFNFTYGADLYPLDPLVFSAVLDWGTLGHAPLFHIRATAGVTCHGWEIFTGYDYRTIGDATIQGIVAGTQVYF